MDSTSETNDSEKRVFARLFRYAWCYRKRLIGGFLISLVAGTSSIGMVFQAGDALEFTFLDVENATLRGTLVICAILVAWVTIAAFAKFASEYLIQWVGQRVVMDLRVELFGHLQELSIATHGSNRTGDMISRVVSDTQMVQRAVSTVLTDLIVRPVLLLSMLGTLIYMDWKLTIGSLLLFPLCIAPILVLGRKVRKASRQGQEKMADLSSVMQEALAGVSIVKAFCGEGREQVRFSHHCKGFFKRSMRVVLARAVNEPIVHFVSAIGVSAVLVYAKRSGMAWPDLLKFAGALVLLYDPVKRLSKVHLMLQQSAGAAERIFGLLDTPLLVEESPDAEDFNEVVQKVSFEQVAFGYDEDRPVFNDLDVNIPAGQSVALVGGSGAGKTTMVNLLLRFFDPDSGSVRINDYDIRDLTFQSLRGQIGYVTQEPFLFNDTVAANIAYGKPDASREEIVAAAKRAHADEFIREMPDGYDTVVGERGTRLSGGQRQRLSIARAIIGDPPILVLDEATSALDSESERLVQQAIDELMGACTVFAIAHRLSTVIKCDQILVLGNGVVLEQGTHHELLEKDGVYKRLYDIQFDVPQRAKG